MKCIGKAKLYDITVEKNRSVGKIYFATKVGEEKGQAVFENDFCNVVFVGKGHTMIKELAKLDDLDKKPIYITESQLRLKSGQREDKSYWNYNELLVFDFEECELDKPKAKPRGGYKRR